MSNENAFFWYAGVGLADRLPYHKKWILFGPLVCEWAAVFSMTKAGFFLGTSLASASKDAAEYVLKHAAEPKSWTVSFENVISDFKSRIGPDTVFIIMNNPTFEILFPETASIKNPNAVMTPEDCSCSIGQRILLGLIFGIQYPALATIMLQAWVNQTEESRRLNVGGLMVMEKPSLSSVDQSKETVLSIYESWKLQIC